MNANEIYGTFVKVNLNEFDSMFKICNDRGTVCESSDKSDQKNSM